MRHTPILWLRLVVLSMYWGTSLLCFAIQLFKYPLEKEGQVGGPILAQEEIKTIFGSIPDIYEVHTRIKVAIQLFEPVIESVSGVIHPEQLLMLINVFWTGGPGRAGDELVRRQECWWHHSEICECDGVLIYMLSFLWRRLSGPFVTPRPFSCQSGELVKAYPPFVNFFEMSKETIVRCEKQKPRFHAFLKVLCL